MKILNLETITEITVAYAKNCQEHSMGLWLEIHYPSFKATKFDKMQLLRATQIIVYAFGTKKDIRWFHILNENFIQPLKPLPGK